MNLYFLDGDNNQHLVVTDAHEENIDKIIELDLMVRRPDFKFRNTRRWWDNFIRMWIDFGSHTEFYLLQDADKAMNVVEDPVEDECDMCKIDIDEGDENSEQ